MVHQRNNISYFADPAPLSVCAPLPRSYPSNRVHDMSAAPAARAAKVARIYVFHDGENLAVPATANIAVLRDSIITETCKAVTGSLPSREPFLRWQMFLPANAAPDIKKQLDTNGISVVASGPKASSVDFKLKEAVADLRDEHRDAGPAFHEQTAVLLSTVPALLAGPAGRRKRPSPAGLVRPSSAWRRTTR